MNTIPQKGKMMTNEGEYKARDIASMTQKEQAEMYLSSIIYNYSDIFDRYKFCFFDIKHNSVYTEIIFKNDFFIISFFLELNRYNYMLLNTIYITIIPSGKECCLSDIVTVLNGNKSFEFDEYSGLDGYRKLWGDVVDKTFEHCPPTWVADVQAYIDRGRVL
jgi:hypothetical protein